MNRHRIDWGRLLGRIIGYGCFAIGILDAISHR